MPSSNGTAALEKVVFRTRIPPSSSQKPTACCPPRTRRCMHGLAWSCERVLVMRYSICRAGLPYSLCSLAAAQRPKVRDRFRDLFKIGEGTYGIVYKANQTSDGTCHLVSTCIMHHAAAPRSPSPASRPAALDSCTRSRLTPVRSVPAKRTYRLSESSYHVLYCSATCCPALRFAPRCTCVVTCTPLPLSRRCMRRAQEV